MGRLSSRVATAFAAAADAGLAQLPVPSSADVAAAARRAILGWCTSKLCRGLWISLGIADGAYLPNFLPGLFVAARAGCPLIISGPAEAGFWSWPSFHSLRSLAGFREVVGAACALDAAALCAASWSWNTLT